MTARARIIAVVMTFAALAGCGGGTDVAGPSDAVLRQRANTPAAARTGRSTIWDLFTNRENADTQIGVNRFIWTAAQDVLDFLPIETADPFSGVIVYGYGTPPGGGPAYRGTVYVQDQALDARSLRVALATRNGPVSDATARAVENAILSRARQLRVAAAAL